MPKLPGRLGTLTAGDIMTRNVTVVHVADTLPDAVHVLRDGNVTGAPVANADGRLVGILSISDLVALPDDDEGSATPPAAALTHGVDRATWDLFDRADALGHTND